MISQVYVFLVTAYITFKQLHYGTL